MLRNDRWLCSLEQEERSLAIVQEEQEAQMARVRGTALFWES